MSEAPERLRSIWQHLGPGILLAATSIGASHLVLAPQAGASFGYGLLWLVLASHLFKYPAFECGPRYAAATGKSLLHGYSLVPGPSCWALYVFLVGTVAQGACVLAGVVNVSGCVLSTWTGLLPTTPMTLILTGLVLLLLMMGGFSWMEQINKVMMAILALATLLAFLPVMPPAGAYINLVKPGLPAGSLLLVAAILGWMPTGIDVSVWHSFWTVEKMKGAGKGYDLRAALRDMRVGYGLSLATAVMFLCLGAVHLAGRGAELRGIMFARAISTTYTAILGRWMANLFMLTAFFAMFSTSYTVVDGFSRSFSEGLMVLRKGWANQKVQRRTYLGFAMGSSALSCVLCLTVGNPVKMVTAAALLSLSIAPLLYLLNLYCVHHHIADQAMRPARLTMVVGVLGSLFMILAAAVTFYVELLR